MKHSEYVAAWKEKNTQPQGRSGGKVSMKTGPVKQASGNPTKGGGIHRPTKGG